MALHEIAGRDLVGFAAGSHRRALRVFDFTVERDAPGRITV